MDRTVDFDWTCSLNRPQHTQEALVCSMQRRFPLDRLCGCVYVFHCDNQDSRVCTLAPLLYFPPRAAGSKRRSSTGRKPLTPEDEITVRPTRDFLPTQEVEAQLRGKGLFLCHRFPSCPCSSCVLLHDPCFVSGSGERAAPSRSALQPGRTCGPLCLHSQGPVSRQSHIKTSGKGDSPDFISSNL